MAIGSHRGSPLSEPSDTSQKRHVRPSPLWRSPFAVVTASALAIIIAFLPVIQMNRQISEQINQLATASSDRREWSLAQSDVEILVLLKEILKADATASAPLSDLRNRFDVFYSRVYSISGSPMLNSVREDQETSDALERLRSFLAETEPLIDSDDRALRSALPELAEKTEDMREDVRRINLSGIRTLSEEADAQRSSVANTLTLVSFLSLAFFAVLVFVVLLLIHFYRRAQERAVEQSLVRSRLASIISTSLDAVIAVNRQGWIIDFNGAAEQIFRYSREEAIGQKMEEMIVPEHLKQAHLDGMDRYRKTGKKHVIGKGRIQIEARRKNGEVFPVELSISTAESEEGEIFVSFLRDISGQLAAEKELIKARDEAIAGEKAKADLIAVMSHEIRTPLNGILGTLELVDPDRLTAKDNEYFEIIRASGKLLRHHVDDVLEISRAESGKIEVARLPFSLPALVHELVDSQRGVSEHRGNSISRAVETHGRDYALGDPVRIRQILLNLIGNAIKFTRNGSIVVEAIRLADSDLVEFRVTDTGVGIAAKDQERIFNDFVTLDTSLSRTVGGTGLGLAIVRRLVKAMDGEVGLESTSGFGSSFWIRLPLPSPSGDAATERDANQDEKPSEEIGPVPPMKILVVEDNKINRVIVRELLEKDGHLVDEALDGQRGIKLAERNSYDLVLMDISMPVIDGIEATRAIREAEPAGTHLPIVALTANVLPSEMDRFLAAGLNEILVKPVSQQGLRAILAKFSVKNSDQSDYGAEEEHADIDSLVDHAHLSDLVNALGAEKISRLVQDFSDEMGETLVSLDKCARSGEPKPEMRDKIHYAAGSSALLGAEALRLTLAKLEAQLAEGFVCDPASSDKLKKIWSVTAMELEAHVSQDGGV